MTAAARSEREYRLAPRRRHWWAKAKVWLFIVLAILLAGMGVAALTPDPYSARPLDPDSTSRAGSHALAALLRDHGTEVVRSTDIDAIPADTTVLVSVADLYDEQQLQQLSAHHRLILVTPSAQVLAATDPSFPHNSQDNFTFRTTIPPDCDLPAAVAAGDVEFDDSDSLLPPDLNQTLPGYTVCYQWRVLASDKLVILQSSSLITNDWLAHKGVAALDINLLSNNGAETRVYWLMAEADTTAQGQDSVWVLFPDWAPRAMLWLLILGFVAALWKAPRHAQVVTEPLPVVVRSAEVVEGHGRLYRKAPGNLVRAAQILRAATVRRLTISLGLGRDTPIETLAAIMDTPGSDALLLGPSPNDNTALVRLAQDLTRLESETDLAAPTTTGSNKTDTMRTDSTP